MHLVALETAVCGLSLMDETGWAGYFVGLGFHIHIHLPPVFVHILLVGRKSPWNVLNEQSCLSRDLGRFACDSGEDGLSLL